MTRKASHTFVSALCAVLFVIAHPAAFAQTATTGDVAGVVKDATDAVIAGATVTLKSLDRGEARTATTNEVGAYRFTFLRPGRYTVAAESTGLKTSVVAINVQVGQVASIDLTAAIQATQQSKSPAPRPPSRRITPTWPPHSPQLRCRSFPCPAAISRP
jgi:hypothetical protein